MDFGFNHSGFSVNVAAFLAAVWITLVIASMVRIGFNTQIWIGILIGCTFGGILHYFFGFTEGYESYIDGETCLCVFFPMFILKLMFGMDTYVFVKSLPQILLVSLTGFVFTVGTTGFIIAYVEGYFSNVLESFFVIVIVGVNFAMYDVPVVDSRHDGVKNLAVICEGEAIFCAVLVTTTQQIIFGMELDFVNKWYHVFFLYIRYICLSIFVGYIFGKLTFIFKIFVDDTLSGVVTYVSCSYMVFIVCEFLFFCNGVLACIIFVLYISKDRSRLFTEVNMEIQLFIDTFFDLTHLVMLVALAMYLTYFFINKISYSIVMVAIVTYVIARILRIFHLLSISPILSRFGYGFDFGSYIKMLCATRKGLGLLISIVLFMKSTILLGHNIEINLVSCIYAMLSYTINGALINKIFNKYKLMELSYSRKINISAGVSAVSDKQLKMISVLKMNRFFSDANWPVINECTKLKSPYHIQVENDEQNLGIRQMTCLKCYKKIYIEPTKKEYKEMTRDAHYKVLKAIGLLLNKQYEHGLLGDREIKVLTQSVESAFETDHFIKLDEIRKLFKIPKFIKRLKILIYKIQSDRIYIKPKQRFRAFCFDVFNSWFFKIFMAIVVITQIILNITRIVFEKGTSWLWAVFLNMSCDMACCTEVAIRIFGYSVGTLNDGCKSYFKNHWNKVDTTTLSISLIASVLSFVNQFYAMPDMMFDVLKYFRLCRLTRVLKIFEVCSSVYPKLLDFYESKIEEKVSYAFTLGLALIMAYEDVIEKLDNMIDSPFIRKSMRSKLEVDKVSLIEYIGMIIRKRPWVAIKVETKQAVYAILKQMRLGIIDLKTTGYIDTYEYERLIGTLNQHYKSINIKKYDQFVPPKQLFSEITYLSGDTETINYLYERATTKIWNAGDVICNPGDLIEGVHILTAGMFKINYIPNSQALQRLATEGLLPVKDFLTNTRFTEEQTEYIVVGNSIGELCTLTGRTYSCKIISYTSSQAFIVSRKCMWEAIENSKDPVNGLSARMWKFLTQALVKRVVGNIPNYRALTDESLSYVLDRSIVPELGAFKNVIFSDLIEDVILVEGYLVDINTGHIYKAPCYIPRSVQHVNLPKYSGIYTESIVETRIMIIPMLNCDEYELVLRMEQNSEINPYASSRFLLSHNMTLEQRLRKSVNMGPKRKSSASRKSTRSQQ